MRLSRTAWLAIVAGVALVAAVAALLLWPRPRISTAPTTGASDARIRAAIAADGDDNSDDDKSSKTASPTKASPAPNWTVDRAASRLTFRGVMDGVDFDGVFRSWDARIAFDPRNLKGSKAVMIVDTESALTGTPIKDQALPNAEWLDITQFPEATLVTRSITQTSPGHYLAVADVKIRGFTRRTTVPFTVSINHDVGRMSATLSLDRRDFHIGEGPWQSPPPVAPSFQVSLRLAAKKSP